MVLFKYQCCWQVVVPTALSFSLIAPSETAYAQSQRVELLLEVKGQPTYELIWQQAESMVRQALREAFSRGTPSSEVTVVASVRYERQTLPLFAIAVSGNEWQRSPEIESWITWTAPFFSFESLLGIGNRTAVPASGPRPVRVDNTDLLEDDPAFRDD